MEEVNFLILGAGLTGLAAASVLGDQAIVLEQEDRPGGLVQAECFDGYWFDHVLHLLYFADPQTESRIRELLGEDLSPCLPEAWVETTLGTVRFPYQMHLGGLAPDTIIRSIRDLAEVTFTPCSKLPLDFEDMLLRTFGRGMCEDFLFPYNRKMWKRPLSTLAPAGFTWNITPPDFQQVIRGALTSDHDFRAYNSTGWYPRPGKDAPIRGMEVLSRALANQAHDLRLRHIVEEIDVEHRRVIARNDGQLHIFQFREACLSTLPLPHVIEMCRPVPERLNHNCQRLTRNRVLMAFLSIKGPRVSGRGHWRYYSDETISFHRLIYMHEFDPDSAPPDGWGLMAEITEPSENPLSASDQILARVRRDIERVGALPWGVATIDLKT